MTLNHKWLYVFQNARETKCCDCYLLETDWLESRTPLFLCTHPSPSHTLPQRRTAKPVQPLVLALGPLRLVALVESMDVVLEIPGKLRHGPEVRVRHEDLALLILLAAILGQRNGSLERCNSKLEHPVSPQRGVSTAVPFLMSLPFHSSARTSAPRMYSLASMLRRMLSPLSLASLSVNVFQTCCLWSSVKSG